MLGIEVLLKKYQIEKNYYDIKFYAPLFWVENITIGKKKKG